MTRGYEMRSLVAVLMLAALPAAAQDRVDERRPAAPDGTVVIESGAGVLRVTGWDRSEVAVSGTLGAGAERLAIRTEDRKTRVEVEPARHSHFAHADLDVKVPAGSQVSIESFQARVEVSGVKGAVRVETVNGSISVTAAADQVHAESVNGGITVRGRSARIHVESVNGPVSVSDPGPDVQAETVNGRLTVAGSSGLARARLDSVNGPLAFSGAMDARGTLDVETVSGAVELALDAAAADYNVSTFNGRIVNELGPPARPSDGRGTGQELVFSTGAGGGIRVSVRTLSGRVKLSAPGQRPARD